MSFSFHTEHHGHNVRFTDYERKIAYRERPRQTYSGAIAFSAEPMQQNQAFVVEITSSLATWSGSLEIGIVYGDLEEAKRAPSASLAKDSVVISVDGVSTNGNVDRVQNFAQASEILRRLRVGDIVGVQLDGVSLKFLYNDEFYPIWDCVNVQNQHQIHGIVDLYGGIYGVELVNYEELFPNSAIFDESRNPFEMFHGFQRPEGRREEVVPVFIRVYQEVLAALPSLLFHESTEGMKISDTVFRRRLKDKTSVSHRGSRNS
ncbi:unnamed protein product [Oikopleura dioica]|uniref:NHR domain-containing protein n=2 Tax=Oikopleura dioica TaxID=34765 RepID=E4YI17_OIKDI|nr:unnamed protein product [Oikopleura dioica]